MTTARNAPAHIGVVVPAHDEEQHLGACLESLTCAARHARHHGHEVTLVVVLDSCQDRSNAIARAYEVTRVSVSARNVGVARHAGVRALPKGVDWLAMTDADTCVPETWLTALYGFDTDAVCGGVHLTQWHGLAPDLRARYLAHQRQNLERHYIHGANLGISMAAYQALGGFRPLRCHEDVNLIERLMASGGSVTWASTCRVMTSARGQARAPDGLGALLHTLAHPAPALTDSQAPLSGQERLDPLQTGRRSADVSSEAERRLRRRSQASIKATTSAASARSPQ